MPRKTKRAAPKGRGLNVAHHLFEGKRVIIDKKEKNTPRGADIGKGSISYVIPRPEPPRAVDIYGN